MFVHGFVLLANFSGITSHACAMISQRFFEYLSICGVQIFRTQLDSHAEGG